MCSKRDVVIFFAGAEALHTLSHIVIGACGALPFTCCSFTLTEQLNGMAIVINAAITVGLIWWASRLKK